mgnify:CR=1 FL=1
MPIPDDLFCGQIAPYLVSQLVRYQAFVIIADTAHVIGEPFHGIRVNGIGPGAVNTELMKRVGHNKELMDTILKRTPIGRVAECAEIGRVAVFLASDDASFMVGQTVYPDGGRMIQSFDREVT